MNAQQMKEAGDLLKKNLPEGTGFVLLTFPVAQISGLQQWNYLSNCERKSMIEGLEAILDKWKNQKVTNN